MTSLKRCFLIYTLLSLALSFVCVGGAFFFLFTTGEVLFFFVPSLLVASLPLGFLVACATRLFKTIYYEKKAIPLEARFVSIERIHDYLRFRKLVVTVEVEYGGETLRVRSLYPYNDYELSYLSVDVPITIGYIEEKNRFIIVD